MTTSDQLATHTGKDPSTVRRRRAPGRGALAVLTAAALAAGIAGVTAVPAAAATTRYEAEKATLSGGAVVASDHTGYSGTGFAGGFTDGNRGTAKASFAVAADAAGSYDLQLGFANGTGSTRTFTLTIDGTARQISLPATASWDSWASVTTTATLSKGSHTIAVAYGSGDNGNANLDYLGVTSRTTSTPTPTPTATPTATPTPTPTPTATQPASGRYEAEDARLAGGAAKETEHSGYTGSGYVGGYIDSRRDLARTTFSVTVASAGDYTLALRYANGTTTTRTLTVDVDTTAQQIELPVTGGWSTWGTQTLTKTLSAGTHTIAYSYGGGDNGNANLDSLTVTEYTAPPPVTEPPSAGEGATVPYDEYVATDLQTTGTKLTPSRTFPSLASESTGRSAVQLKNTGDSISLKLRKAANSVVVRYSIPPKADGSVNTATLSVYAGSTHVKDLDLTTQYSWLYNDFYNDTRNPGGTAHRYYDEARAIIPDQAAGTTITLKKDAGDTAASYTIDLIDTEQVAVAGSMPSGYRSAADFGISPDGSNQTSRIDQALATLKGSGTGLWFPRGEYLIDGRISYESVDIKGAGMWWTTIRSTAENGAGGLYTTGGKNSVSDLTLLGKQTSRNGNQGATGIEGIFTSGSEIKNVWIEHMKVGIWARPSTNGLSITGVRVRNVFADGIHFHGGTTNSTVKQSVIRSVGDDGIAFNTENLEGGSLHQTTDCVADHNTIAAVNHANGIGVYGGGRNTISANLVSDTNAYGSGITVSSRFGDGFTGKTTVSGNRLVRTGAAAPGFEDEPGGIWIVASKQDLNQPIEVSGNTILDSLFSGIKVSYPGRVADLQVKGNTITGAGTWGFEVRASSGQATLTSNTVTGARSGGTKNGGNGFTIVNGGGNSGL